MILLFVKKGMEFLLRRRLFLVVFDFPASLLLREKEDLTLAGHLDYPSVCLLGGKYTWKEIEESLQIFSCLFPGKISQLSKFSKLLWREIGEIRLTLCKKCIIIQHRIFQEKSNFLGTFLRNPCRLYDES